MTNRAEWQWIDHWLKVCSILHCSLPTHSAAVQGYVGRKENPPLARQESREQTFSKYQAQLEKYGGTLAVEDVAAAAPASSAAGAGAGGGSSTPGGTFAAFLLMQPITYFCVTVNFRNQNPLNAFQLDFTGRRPKTVQPGYGPAMSNRRVSDFSCFSLTSLNGQLGNDLNPVWVGRQVELEEIHPRVVLHTDQLATIPLLDEHSNSVSTSHGHNSIGAPGGIDSDGQDTQTEPSASQKLEMQVDRSV